MKVNPGDDVRDLHVEMIREGRITGRLLMANGLPAPGESVFLNRSVYVDGRLRLSRIARPGSVVTDDQGHFEFTDTPPGAYTLFAWTNIPEGAWTNAEYLAKYTDRGTGVIVREGQRLEDLRVIMIYD